MDFNLAAFDWADAALVFVGFLWLGSFGKEINSFKEKSKEQKNELMDKLERQDQKIHGLMEKIREVQSDLKTANKTIEDVRNIVRGRL